MADFKLPDPKGNSGRILGLGLLAGAGLLFYAKILPFLISIAWGTVELGIAAAVAGVLLYILTSRKFWTRTKIILDSLGEMLFGWFIEMNPFVILELQLSKIEKDREDLMKHNSSLRGQESLLAKEIAEHQNEMRIAAEEVEICKRKLSLNPNDEDTHLALETSTNTFNNSKDFVDSVTPIYNDIKKLSEYTEKAYRKSGNALKNARYTLTAQRRKYELVTAGENAMKKALRAFTGDPEMNKAANIALEKLQKDIASKVGTIRTTLKATTSIMNERDLRDVAKLNMAVSTIESLNMDESLDYTPAIDGAQGVGVPVMTHNKYLQTLKDNKNGR